MLAAPRLGSPQQSDLHEQSGTSFTLDAFPGATRIQTWDLSYGKQQHDHEATGEVKISKNLLQQLLKRLLHDFYRRFYTTFIILLDNDTSVTFFEAPFRTFKARLFHEYYASLCMCARQKGQTLWFHSFLPWEVVTDAKQRKYKLCKVELALRSLLL